MISMFSSTIQKLREYFEKFPGIGPRQAQRFVYWLLSENPVFIKELGDLLLKLRQNSKQCEMCFRFFEGAENRCRLCSGQTRDDSRLLIVEKDSDLETIEKTGVYNGRYFVLGDIVPFGQILPKNIRLKELYNRAGKGAEKGLKEIILAFSATAEGDNTTRYVEKILEPLAKKFNVKISSFGRGLSTGTELEYIDRDTLKNALNNRK